MNFLYRFYVLAPLLVGCAIAIPFATLIEFRFYHTAFLESLLILYAVVAWEFRAWRQFRIPLPIAIIVGGVLAGYWEPLISSMHRHSFPGCLLDPCCGLSGVVFGLVGACFATILTALLTPFDPRLKRNAT